jgi:HlyD family secretion protein
MIASGAILLMVAGTTAWRITAANPAPAFAKTTVSRGTVQKTISATGRLQALRTVQVGTQVSGTLSEIYVDFNSKVKKGEVIARIDPSNLQAQLTQALGNQASVQAGVQTAQTSVAGADAAVEAAQANVERLDSAVSDAQRNLDRQRELVREGVGPRRDLETAEAAAAQAIAQRQQGLAQLNQARAQAQAARSQLAQARAQANQAAAQVEIASVNLGHATITAPIDGVIVARNVDVGQTVAASFQAPVLFLIANDLTQMQVLADIDEADVGQLREGTPVTFTVDAYPSETFEGHVSQVRLEPQTVQNVVTYTAVIDVPNPELKLKPGMTANVTATVAERDNVMTVPNAALRFRPENAGEVRTKGPVVWRVKDKQLEPVQIRAGLSDGIVTEIISGDLRQGDEIAVAAQGGSTPQAAATNPFMPSRRGGRR